MATAPGPQQEHPRSLVFNYLLFASLGVACSLLWHSYYSVGPGDNLEQLLLLSTHTHMYTLEEVKTVLQGTDCEDVKQEAKISEELMYGMGTKLRYQFNPIVQDSELVEQCRAIKVYGLIRHGARYPTAKHLARWTELRRLMPTRLPSADSALSPAAKALMEWKNQIGQDVPGEKAGPADLTEGGMKEQYCLGQRMRERFPESLKKNYSPFSFGFRSTQSPRAINSSLSYAQGLFQETNPEAISITTMDEDKDVYLRYDELPCKKYDQKVTHNKSELKRWFNTFFNTPVYKEVLLNIQRQFNSRHWKLEPTDILTFYDICVHEMSILGSSRWCELFSREDLSVMEYYKDMKAYWIKGRGYPITGKRSVYLVKAILKFLTDGKQFLSLNFAHTETILPLLAFLDTFPVPHDLTPTNYQEQRDRSFVTSQITPYSANVYLVLYDCRADPEDLPEHYVRLLVNEEPVEMGLCRAWGADDEGFKWGSAYFMCPLEVLRESAYNATGGFSELRELCKVTR